MASHGLVNDCVKIRKFLCDSKGDGSFRAIYVGVEFFLELNVAAFVLEEVVENGGYRDCAA